MADSQHGWLRFGSVSQRARRAGRPWLSSRITEWDRPGLDRKQ
ncbi:hypothetical protein PSNTI_37070 [Stutzerimonas stutzeri]|nr:hypothetical protein PSNTI_37070 [Stutzerimonas stutzeri]